VLLALFCIPSFITLFTVFSSSSTSYTPKTQVVGGCWQQVRAELGLSPLPDILLPSPLPSPSSRPISRVELRRVKRELFARDAPLFLASDAVQPMSSPPSSSEIWHVFRDHAMHEMTRERQFKYNSRSRRRKATKIRHDHSHTG